MIAVFVVATLVANTTTQYEACVIIVGYIIDIISVYRDRKRHRDGELSALRMTSLSTINFLSFFSLSALFFW